MNKAFIGIISYLGNDVNYRTKRLAMHGKQVEEIRDTFQKMKERYNEDPIPVIRVEQEWTRVVHAQVDVPGIDIESISTGRLTPGAARNLLLKRLYESDYDWLICTDDDHWLYPRFAGYRLLWELSKGGFDEMAQNLMAFSAFPSYWYGTSSFVDPWGKEDTHWLFIKTKHPGAMPFCCIPNLKKYKGKELYFNEATDCAAIGSAPEDLQFFFDWCCLGGRWLESVCMVGKSLGDLNYSSLFDTPNARKARDLWVKNEWRVAYLKKKFPRQPALWDFREFGVRRNPGIKYEVERFWKGLDEDERK